MMAPHLRGRKMLEIKINIAAGSKGRL